MYIKVEKVLILYTHIFKYSPFLCVGGVGQESNQRSLTEFTIFIWNPLIWNNSSNLIFVSHGADIFEEEYMPAVLRPTT